ncbi:MAG: type II secretion system F family protein [Armatimonadetes bacterium]|nr:type II secretion system F family protein [Armatimonadota bacterium]
MVGPILPIIIGTALLAAVFAALAARQPAGQESESKGRVQEGARSADRAPLLTGLLSATGVNGRLQQQLLAAGMLLRPSELAAISLVAGGIAFGAVVALKHSLVLAAPAGVAGVLAPYATVLFRAGQRQTQFRKQLPEALEMIATALRSGYAFARAVQLVAEQMSPPLSEEAQRLVDELAVGIGLNEALENLSERQPSYEVKLFAAAVQIQTRVGGNLADILLKTAQMMREREQLRKEIAALTAEGRMSAAILAALPVVLALAVHHTNPGYMEILFEDPLGKYLLAAAAGLMFMGLLTIKQLISVEM